MSRKYDVTFILEKRSRDRGDGKMEQPAEDFKVFLRFYDILLSLFKFVEVENSTVSSWTELLELTVTVSCC